MCQQVFNDAKLLFLYYKDILKANANIRQKSIVTILQVFRFG